ncbi:MAG: ATP-binding protein [Desulfobulbaceae bacterium]|nr:ATP-binding protein [Desulfobulbaceae bacterium]
MLRFWPKSFFALVLLAMALISLPLFGVLLASDLLMDRLVKDSSASVYRSVTTSQLSQTLQEQITNQERRLRQYQVLGDVALHDELLAIIEQIDTSLASLHALPQSDQAKNLLTRLSKTENKIREAFSLALSPQLVALNDNDFTTLNDLGRQIYHMSLDGVYQEVENLHKEEAHAEKLLLALASTCLPLTILLALFLTRLIARPIKQVDQGIHLLGQGEFEKEITVSGPEDMVFLGQRLNWLRRKLHLYEQEKNKFASHISHELKTPLASIYEAAELLSDGVVGPVSNEQREVILILHKNCSHLKNLIENLVGITMAQAEKTCLNLTDFPLEDLVNETITPYKPAILKNELILHSKIEPMTIHGDRPRLKNVLDNLLSNAIKYTPAEGVITINALRQENNAIIEIRDSGPGIPATEREQIFSPFFQGSAVCQSHIKGTGLGLAIAHEYVLAHNGTLELTRHDEPGACFRLTLPLTS